jgi:hypothetical protein
VRAHFAQPGVQPRHEVGRRLDSRKVTGDQQATTNRRVVPRTRRALQEVPLHRHEIGLGQHVIDERDVALAELRTIHQGVTLEHETNVDAIIASGKSGPGSLWNGAPRPQSHTRRVTVGSGNQEEIIRRIAEPEDPIGFGIGAGLDCMPISTGAAQLLVEAGIQSDCRDETDWADCFRRRRRSVRQPFEFGSARDSQTKADKKGRKRKTKKQMKESDHALRR